jgi:hypothetical protein
LGHANGVLLHQVYGRYVPRQEEREKWERVAATQDEASNHQDSSGTTDGTTER